MKNPVRTLSFLSLAVLAAATSAGCENPADNKSKAAVGEAKAVPPVAPTAAGTATAVETLPISSETSTVGFVGSKVTGKHDGGFKQFTGALTFDPAAPEKSQLKVEIDAASVFSDDEKLTGHLKSPDFFDVATFPKASFVSTEITRGDKGATHTITGNLEMHGVTKSVTFPAVVAVAPDAVTAKAEFVINRKDWKIVYPGMPDDLIRDEVVVKLDIKAPRK